MREYVRGRTAESNCGAAYDVDGYDCYEVSDETGFVCLPR